MRTDSRSRVVLLAVLTIAGAGMSISAALAASPDACALLTPADISTVLGVEVGPGERLMPTETRFCTWHEQGKKQNRNVRVDFISDRQYEMGKTPLPNVVKTPESGIGDDAYFSKVKGMVFTLSVMKGSTFFRVAARSSAEAFAKANDAANDDKDKDIDRAIARAILKKL
jgi:hypothetical protein